MTQLLQFSNDLADLVASAAPSVVQVLGARRAVSGIVYGPDIVLTNARAMGREDGLRVRPAAGADPIESELAGWDPATGIAVLRTQTAVGSDAPRASADEPKPGQIVVAIARSWSNAVTASAGNVAIVGGPLRTGRRREIARVFRMAAPLHDGFAGAGIFDAAGQLTGMATASAIRGFPVGIPASIVLAAAARVLERGTRRRGYAGVSVQPVELPRTQRPEGRERALLVMGVSSDSPAERAGLMIGDAIFDVDGHSATDPEELLDLLTSKGAGQEISVRLLRGGAEHTIRMILAERPHR